MKKYVIGFNGPPGSGKDTAAQMAGALLTDLGFEVAALKYADTLKLAVNQFCNVRFPELPHEELKPKATPWGDATFRDAYIAFSEKFAKPLWGIDVFGRIIAQEIAQDDGDIFDNDGTQSIVYIISDCGFEPEQHPVIDVVGPENYALIQMYRDGHTFDGDSRTYIDPKRGTVSRMFNNQDLEQLAVEVREIVTSIVRTQEWVAREEPQGTEG